MAEATPGAEHDADARLAELPEYSDEALAQVFASRTVGRARFVQDWNRWLFFIGARWSVDRLLHAIREARVICAEAAARVMADTHLTEKQRTALAVTIESAQKIYAVEKLARSDASIAAGTEMWDKDPWLLNTPAGTVDLRTGTLRDHRAADCITKCTAVAPSVRCVRFMQFLNRVCGGRGELVNYLQRVVGYVLTGSTREHALFFLYGLGANGKSTFLDVLRYILGDYAVTAPMETFIETRGDRHPTDLAMMRGARLVVASETEEGGRWAAAKVKALTGGEPISARFMRQDFFEFTPRFKLVISGNHKPGLRNVDEAVRRRFNLVPFTETIPVEERDPELAAKLKAEGPGILAWAIEGCLAWQQEGLAPPATVRAATDSYLAEEDVFSAWLVDCCECGGKFTLVAELHASYKRWAVKYGERELSIKRFSQQLQERGFERDQDPSDRSRGFRGIRLKLSEIDL